MAQTKQGDKVAIHFTGKLDDGTVVDATQPEGDHACGCGGDHDHDHQHGPFELTIGSEEFYLPIEKALVGMEVGEKKTVVITPDEAFGDYDKENVFNVQRSDFPEDEITPELGLQLEVTGEDDENFVATIIKMTDEELTLDANHPLAGEELTYEFELVEILDK